MGIRRGAAFAAVAAIFAAVFTGSAAAAADPVPSTCGYAVADGGGAHASSICWFDFTGYDEGLTTTSAGQQFEMVLGAYDVSFTVTQRGIPGWTGRSVAARAATSPPFILGVNGYYEGIPGQPFLYTSAGQANGAATVAISNVQVTLDGTPVSGYELVTAAPETPDAPFGTQGEFLHWTSDAPLTMIDSGTQITSGGGCSVPLTGNGTTDVWCYPGGPGSTTAYGNILSAPSATRISGDLYMWGRNEREGLAFGIRTATLTLNKQVNGRVDAADSFDVSATTSGGAVLGSATTGIADAASTGTIPVLSTQPITLADTAAEGAPSSIDYYDAEWACTNASPDSATTLPSGAGSTRSLSLVPGDAVDCTVTNTSKSASMALVKSVTPTTAAVGDSVTYDFEVTNTGDLPLASVTIDENAFTGTGPLGPIDCPATVLDPGESTTCQADYTVTQADVDAGLVTNDAIAAGRVTGTSASVESELSAAELITAGEAALDVVKTADAEDAEVGDEATFSLTATNTGTVTLTDVTLADVDFTGAGELGSLVCDLDAPVVLAPRETLTCTTSYVATAADVGGISNTAEASGDDPSGETITDDDTVAVAVTAESTSGTGGVTVPPTVDPADGGSSLATTGGSTEWHWALLALGLVLVGAATRVASARRRRS